jgi:heme-degrading monooxygenase HmoA
LTAPYYFLYSPFTFTGSSFGLGESFMAVKIFIRRVIAEERINDLLPLFRRLRNLATNQPGYISGETLKRIDTAGEYLVVSTWQSLDNWREWVVCRERIEIQNEIDARLDQDTTYEIYQYG